MRDFFHIWEVGSGCLFELIEKEFNYTSDLKIVAGEEYIIGASSRELAKKVSDKVKESGHKIYIVLGIDNSNNHAETYFKNNRITSVLEAELIFWPMFWAYKCSSICTFGHSPNKHPKDITPEYYPKKHFTSYNFQPRVHRCLLQDHLAKEGLLESNDYTWYNTDYFLDGTYEWKYWTPQVHTVDENFKQNINSYEIHSSYFETALQVVSETNPWVIFYTEKTMLPIIFNKPLLIFGAPHINRRLESFGFKLYNFDYTFDSILDLNKRVEVFAKTVKELCKKTPEEIYQENKEIAFYNKQRLLEILTSPELIPDEIYKWDSLYRDNNNWNMHFQWLTPFLRDEENIFNTSMGRRKLF